MYKHVHARSFVVHFIVSFVLALWHMRRCGHACMVVCLYVRGGICVGARACVCIIDCHVNYLGYITCVHVHVYACMCFLCV